MLFSIITPTYNRADKIGIAIQSVLDQSCQNFELIIVDDGSTDNTEDVVNSFEDHRLFYFKKKNEERNIARNYGIKKATGEYICFLDSDDILYSNHLSEAKLLIDQKNNPEVVHLNFEFIGSENKPSSITAINKDRVNIDLIDSNMLLINSIFIRNDIANKFHFLESPVAVVGEDLYLWLRLASRFKIHLSLKVTNAVREHNKRSLNNIDVDKLELGTKEIHFALNKDLDFIKYYGWRAKRYFAYSYIFLSLHLVLHKRDKESFNYLLIASRIYPPSIFSKRFLVVIKQILFR